MSNDNAPQNVDLNAIANQIQVLKNQRSAALDDVAILLGNLESLKIKMKELNVELEAFKSKETNEPNNTATSDDETSGG